MHGFPWGQGGLRGPPSPAPRGIQHKIQTWPDKLIIVCRPFIKGCDFPKHRQLRNYVLNGCRAPVSLEVAMVTGNSASLIKQVKDLVADASEMNEPNEVDLRKTSLTVGVP